MLGSTLTYNDVPAISPKVIFDTNAYRNFVLKYLTKDDKNEVVEKLKAAEEKFRIIPSSNLLTILELYQHLDEDDEAFEVCKKAILFSFYRSYVNGSFCHQPFPELEISAKLFDLISDCDNAQNNYFLSKHIEFCLAFARGKTLNQKEFSKEVIQKVQSFKDKIFDSIISNVQQLFPDFDSTSLTFSEKDFRTFKRNYGNKRPYLYANLGISLFRAFGQRLNVKANVDENNDKIVNLIMDYRPAFHSFVIVWEKFLNNKNSSKSVFAPNKNDLIDSFILFSVVPEDNIYFVTDEVKIHKLFKEIDLQEYVLTLDNYLTKIGFNVSSQ